MKEYCRHRRTGPVFFFFWGGAHTFLVRFARIMNPLPGGGGGGGGGWDSCIFFFILFYAPEICSVF